MKITIIGGGNIGTLLAAEFSKKGYETYIFSSKNNGIGNIEFNQGDKTKYAYHIDKIYKIDPINLKTLKEKYHFTPPQGYAYDTRYENLTNYLKSVVK